MSKYSITFGFIRFDDPENIRTTTVERYAPDYNTCITNLCKEYCVMPIDIVTISDIYISCPLEDANDIVKHYFTRV